MELLPQEGFLAGIKALGIDDLTEKQISYLLRVLAKTEIDGNIIMQDFLQIMENLGLFEPEDDHMEDTEISQELARAQGKKEKSPLDLSQLDQKSVKIMVMLMITLLNEEMTTQEFFEEVIFRQNVKTKTKHFPMLFLQSSDFFRVLKEKGIRKKDTEHENLREFLQLNPQNPDLILLKNIKKALE